MNISKNDQLLKLEEKHFFDISDNIIDDTFEKSVILPNLYMSDESESFYLDETLFTMYFDNIINRTFNTNLNNVCLFKSIFVSDYFITIDFVNFLYKIPSILKLTLDKCQSMDIRFYIIPIKLILNYKNAHSNIIIIDNNTLRIEFFEPHGDSFKGATLPYNIEYYIKLLLSNLFPIKINLYNFINVQQHCPYGLQVKQNIVNPMSGHCLAWSLLFINIRLNNLQLTSDDIIEYFNTFSPNDLNSYIKRFIGFLEKNNKIITKTMSTYEYNFKLLEEDNAKIYKRISELIELYLTIENNSIFEELMSYHNHPLFYSIFFETINKLQCNK
jgi:hypothetical protein